MEINLLPPVFTFVAIIAKADFLNWVSYFSLNYVNIFNRRSTRKISKNYKCSFCTMQISDRILC